MAEAAILAVGSRIWLRELTLDDWIDVHAYSSLPEVCRFQAWGPNSPEQTEAFVREAVGSANEQPRARYALAVSRLGSPRAVGMGELRIHSPRFRSAEIAYTLHPDYWGQGLGTELAQLLLGLGFTDLKLHRIWATCDPRNKASGRILQKIGMAYEGRMRETQLIRDGWRDSDLYAILESDPR